MDAVVLFPGQGSQKPGMGKQLHDSFDEAKRAFDEADEALGEKLSELCFEGSAEDLALTHNAQPAILATSVACFRVLKKEIELTPVVCAGHSLGEYSALVAAGVLGFADALRLVRLRGQAMQKAVPVGKGGMAAVMGLGGEDVSKLCQEVSEGQSIAPANFNGGGQVVVSGDMDAVDRVVANAKKFGAKRAIKLKVSAPFHSELMAPASKVMEEALKDVALGDFSCPVISNVDASPYPSKADAVELLVRQITGAVKWEQSIAAIENETENKNAIECGHGTVLKGLCKRIGSSLALKSFGMPEDLDAFR